MAKKIEEWIAPIEEWIATTLVNDESSSDEELVEHFQKEGKMSKSKARCYVKQRARALREPLEFELETCEDENWKDSREQVDVEQVEFTTHGLRVGGGKICMDEDMRDDCSEFSFFSEKEHEPGFTYELESGRDLSDDEVKLISRKAVETLIGTLKEILTETK